MFNYPCRAGAAEFTFKKASMSYTRQTENPEESGPVAKKARTSPVITEPGKYFQQAYFPITCLYT